MAIINYDGETFFSGRLTKDNLSGFNQINCIPAQKMNGNAIAVLALAYLKRAVPEIKGIRVTGGVFNKIDTSLVQFTVTFK